MVLVEQIVQTRCAHVYNSVTRETRHTETTLSCITSVQCDTAEAVVISAESQL